MDDLVRFTDRLRLEPLAPQHLDDLVLIHQDEGVTEWFGEWDHARASERIDGAAAGRAAHGIEKWMAYERQTGEVIGRGGCSVVQFADEDLPCFEIGWTLRDRWRGRGFATEIGREALCVVFDDLDAPNAVAFTEPANTASRAVMERLQMSYTRELHHDGYDFVLYTITRADFVRMLSPAREG